MDSVGGKKERRMIRKLEPRSPAHSESLVSELMMPHQVNNHGHVFGGVILSMVDRVAGVASMRHSGVPCVTVSFDRVDFKEPIFTGELVTCAARVNFVGRTSMEIGVRVEAENLFSGETRHTNTCFLTFVAIDANHRPIPVPPLKLETEEEQKRFREGQRRREVRMALAKELGDS
jgi:acyl-CoA hydrolase